MWSSRKRERKARESALRPAYAPGGFCMCVCVCVRVCVSKRGEGWSAHMRF